MEEFEALDIRCNRIYPSNWKTYKDKRKFGWNLPRKNRKSKRGYKYSKEYRKEMRRLRKQEAHRLLFKII
jgi:hypothetical protein